MNPYWMSNADNAPGSLTLEQLEAGFKAMEERVRIPHGTPENPHIVSRRSYDHGGGFCHECGQWFPPHDTPGEFTR